MSYDPQIDFLALARRTVIGAELARAPMLDLVLSALARAGFISLSVGQTAPAVNQATTVWLQPAQPSWTAEGVLWLWDVDTATYVRATPNLFTRFLGAPVTGDGFMYVGSQLMQWGTALVNNNLYTQIAFPKIFGGIPRVQVTPKAAPVMVASGVSGVSENSFVAAVDGVTPLEIDWLATGPA